MKAVNRKKLASSTLLLLLFMSVLTLTIVAPVKSDYPFPVITIMADGNVDPVDAPIAVDGNVYSLTENIATPIVVEKDEIVVDGAFYKLIGAGQFMGISLYDVFGVTVRNFVIQGFENGIFIREQGRHFVYSNYIAENGYGISFYYSTSSYVTNNVVAENDVGFYFEGAVLNTVAFNLIIDNADQIDGDVSDNFWTDESGYGNFWSNYWGEDTDGDGIGDTGALPHEGVDDNPLVDPSIPMQFGELPFGPDWWLSGSCLVWRGGWSPVDIQVTDAMGQVISASENEIGLNAFYAEEWQGDTKLVMILVVVPVPLDDYEGLYDFQMTAGADLTYWLNTLVSHGDAQAGIGGEILYRQSVEDVFLGNGQTRNVGVVLTRNEDGSVNAASDDPVTRLEELIETVEDMALPKGIEDSLTAKLENAIKSLDQGNGGEAVEKLMSFIEQAEALRDKKLTAEQADQLTVEAQRIIDLIQG